VDRVCQDYSESNDGRFLRDSVYGGCKKVCRRTLVIDQGRESEREGSHRVFGVDVFFVLLLCIQLSSDLFYCCLGCRKRKVDTPV